MLLQAAGQILLVPDLTAEEPLHYGNLYCFCMRSANTSRVLRDLKVHCVAMQWPCKAWAIHQHPHEQTTTGLLHEDCNMGRAGGLANKFTAFMTNA